MGNIEKYGVGGVGQTDDMPTTLPQQVPATGFFDISVERIRTARAIARKPMESLEYCKAMIQEPELAAEMIWKKKIGGEWKEGPSARLAEIAAAGWGNIAVAGNVFEPTGTTITAEGLAVDIERNLYYRVTETKSILDKNGKRYSEHMIMTTGKAAQSTAMRNATFKAIGGAFINKLMDHAREVASGGDIRGRLTNALNYFTKHGVSSQEILDYLHIKSIDQAQFQHLQQLESLYVALKDGETTIAEEFGRREKREKADEISKPAAPAARTNPSSHTEEPPPPRHDQGRPRADGSTAPSQPDLLDECQQLLGKRAGKEIHALLSRAGNDETARIILRKTPPGVIAALLKSTDPISELETIKDGLRLG